MVKVIESGFYTTVQDLGRFGFQQFGVPVSGVMDSYSAKVANALLHNSENDAVLEITMSGSTLQFNCNTCICIAGADISPKLNNKFVKLNSVLNIKKGDIISFGKLKYGYRCYLAVSGGFQTEISMNSRSMYKSITSRFVLARNDELAILEHDNIIKKSNASIKINTNHFWFE